MIDEETTDLYMSIIKAHLLNAFNIIQKYPKVNDEIKLKHWYNYYLQDLYDELAGVDTYFDYYPELDTKKNQSRVNELMKECDENFILWKKKKYMKMTPLSNEGINLYYTHHPKEDEWLLYDFKFRDEMVKKWGLKKEGLTELDTTKKRNYVIEHIEEADSDYEDSDYEDSEYEEDSD